MTAKTPVKNTMSLRQIAGDLGITPAYLSYMVNGKRPWRADLYERYGEPVNTFHAHNATFVNTSSADSATKSQARSAQRLV